MSDKAASKPTELVDDPDDPELSALLDSALADFGRPSPSTAAPTSAHTAAPTAGEDAGSSQQKDMKDAYKVFEEAMKQALQGAPDPTGSAGAAGDATFSSLMASLTEEMARSEVEGADDPLAKTLADLSKNLSSDAEKVGDEPDMADLLRTFSGAGDAPDAASLDAFMPLMQTVMSSILSKDVLYPSLKDVASRYPAWLDEHGPALSDDDRDRYTRQHKLMEEVCAVFEEQESDGADGDASGRQERIFVLMQKMQALGQPPKELVGESELGLTFDEEGNPRLPAGFGGAAGADCAVM